MAKPLKIFLAVVGLVLVLMAGAVGAVALLFDPNDYKDDIEQAVEEATGREFTLAGDLELKVFPWLAVRAHDATMANAEGFDGPFFAQVGQLSASVRLLPVFSGNVEFGTVLLDGLRMNLQTDSSSKNNWDDLAANEPDDSDATSTEQDHSDGISMHDLSIQAVEVRDASVRYTNAQTGLRQSLEAFNLTTGRVSLGKPVALSSDFELRQSAGDGPAQVAQVDLVAEVLANIEAQTYRADNLHVDVKLSGEAVPNQEQQFNLRGSARTDLANGKFSIRDLALQAVGGTLTGELEGSGLGAPEGMRYEGSVSIDSINPRAVLAALGMSPPAARDNNALTQFSLQSDISGSPGQIGLSGLTAKLDDTTLTGTASVGNIDSEAPAAVRFELQVDRLNADRYAAPVPEDDAPPAETPSTDETEQPPAEEAELPLELIEALDVDGTLRVGELTLAGAQVTEALLTLRSRPGTPLTQTLNAKLYGGTVEMNNEIAPGSEQSPPQFQLKGSLDQILAGALLKDSADQDWIDGSGFIRYDLTTSGSTATALKRALDGTISLNLQDGAIRGVNLQQLMAIVQQYMTGAGTNAEASSSAETSGGSTQFDNLGATLHLNNGIVRNDDLNAGNSDFGVRGTGQFSLLDMQLDYTLNTTLKQLPADSPLKRLEGRNLPVRVTGNATNPKVRLDMAGLLRAEAESRIREKVGEELQRGLGRLFGRTAPPPEPADNTDGADSPE